MPPPKEGMYEVIIDGSLIVNEVKLADQWVRLANEGDFAERRQVVRKIKKCLPREARSIVKFDKIELRRLRDAQQAYQRVTKSAVGAKPVGKDKVLAREISSRVRVRGHR